jgi:hypothetical protein
MSMGKRVRERPLFGIGTPRGLQGRLAALGGVLSTLRSLVCKTITPIGSQTGSSNTICAD